MVMGTLLWHLERIYELERHFFTEPKFFPIKANLKCVLDVDNMLPHQLKGQLKCIGSPEMRDALRAAISNAVARLKTAKELEAWKDVMLSIPCTFSLSNGKRIFDMAFKDVVQSREDVGTIWANTRISNLMRTYEIQDIKQQMGNVKQGKHEIFAFYKGVKFAEGSEEVSVTFIEVSNMLQNGVLIYHEVKELLFRFDKLGLKNPIDSINKIREIAIFCNKEKDKMIWCLQMLWDMWMYTSKDRGSIPIRLLKNDALEITLIQLIWYKKSIKDYLNRKMEGFHWTDVIKARIRQEFFFVFGFN